ncbi:hypothetical protein TWF694_006610 [Orbilia ellipsospora]|uniref:Uncharacterized protein n=1 Tax=Orbilia ellipsospora TaxID=2528407 RepID=A0AAV9XM04_9PEZI
MTADPKGSAGHGNDDGPSSSPAGDSFTPPSSSPACAPSPEVESGLLEFRDEVAPLSADSIQQ